MVICEGGPVWHGPGRHRFSRQGARDRWRGRRLRERSAGTDGRTLRRRPACCSGQHHLGQYRHRASQPRQTPQAGPALRARRASGPRRRAHAEPGAEHVAHAHGNGPPQRLDFGETLGAAGAGPDQPLQRQGWRPGRGGQEPQRRQPAEIHRRPRDRRQPPAADREPAHLGRGRGRGGADPRRTAATARPGLRRARRQRRAGRVVRDLRDLRPAARRRQGPPVAERAGGAGHGGKNR